MTQTEAQFQQVTATMTERQIHIGSVEPAMDRKLDSTFDPLREEISHMHEIWDEFKNWMMDQYMTMLARQNQVRLLACLLSREYFDLIILGKRLDPMINPYSIVKPRSSTPEDKTVFLEMNFGMSKEENSNKKEVANEALELQEFLKMKQPKEKSGLWKTDSLLTLDFEQKKKYFDLSSIDKKDDCNNGNNIDSEKHYPEENYNDRVARTTGTKEQLDSFEKEVYEENIRGDIIRSLDQKVTDSANQFPKLKANSGELSKTEIKIIGFSEVEIDSAFCNEQWTGSEMKEPVAIVKTNDVPSKRFQEGNKKLLSGVAEKAKHIT